MASSLTKSTIAMTVTRIDQVSGPSAAAGATGGQAKYWVTANCTTPDSTTKLGTSIQQLTFDMSAGTVPLVGDTFNLVFN